MESGQRPVELHYRLLDPKRDRQLHRSKQTADRTRVAIDNVHSRDSEKKDWPERSYQHSSAEGAKRRACVHAWILALLSICHGAWRIVDSGFTNPWGYLCGIHVATLPIADGKGRTGRGS